jgi:hypothetical protein
MTAKPPPDRKERERLARREQAENRWSLAAHFWIWHGMRANAFRNPRRRK